MIIRYRDHKHTGKHYWQYDGVCANFYYEDGTRTGSVFTHAQLEEKVSDGSLYKEIVNDAAVLPKLSETGDGHKKDAGKLRYDLMPAGPLAELARVYTIGAAKYQDRGWEKGMRWGRLFAAMMRHAWRWWGGEKLDPVDGQHHLASVAWCALALIEYETTCPQHDDRAKAA